MRSNLIFRFNSSLKEEGFKKTLQTTLDWGLLRLGVRQIDPVIKRRVEISKQIDALFQSTVRYGPFQGLKFSTESWWGAADRGSMLLGLYEKEVLASLSNIAKKYNTFIDLGAGDGYYGIGVLVNGLFEKSYCFEISEKGRRIIKQNAICNDVDNRLEILGAADKHFYNGIPKGEIDKSVLFVDIEGAEFDLFDEATFKAFSNSIIFIELHDWFFIEGEKKLIKLRNDASTTHTSTELTMSERDPSKFEELKKFSDDERWLVCSEGRGQVMIWLRFDPVSA